MLWLASTRLSPRGRLAGFVLLTALLCAACEREPAPVPPPRLAPGPAPEPAPAPEPPQAEAEPPQADPDLDSPPPVSPSPPAAGADAVAPVGPGDPAGPPQQPEGVAFPLPDPLPPECVPRSPADPGAGLRPGPDPLQGWLGGTGKGEGQFTYPRALAVSREGHLYVVDKTGRIQKFDPDGRLLRSARTPAIDQGMPTCLSIAPSGDLLVADTHYCRVLTYSPDLELRGAFGVPGLAPGRFLLLTGVYQTSDGRIYTTDYGDYEARLQVFDREGKHLAAIGTFGTGDAELRRPMSVCVDEAAGRVYVADAVNHRIAVFGRDATWIEALAGPEVLRFPYSIVQDEAGRLWVAEFGGHRVSVLDPRSGAVLGRFGQPGRALGQLSNPWGVVPAPGGRVWLLDSGNDRVYALPRAAILGAQGEPG